MTIGFATAHPAYWQFVTALQNGTFNSTALGDLYESEEGWLHPVYVAVTENNTALFRPLEPGPLLAAQLPVAFQDGGVYLFRVAGYPVPEAAAAAGPR